MEQTNLLKFIQVDHIPFAIAVIVVAVVLSKLGSRSLDALAERFTGRRLLFKQLIAISRFTILIVATGLVVGNVLLFTDDVMTALAGAAVGLGFAFKDLVASLIAGVILLFDRPFQVGDRISFGGQYGEVVEIGIRAVRINTLDDNLVSIPNNRFLLDDVSCANAGELHQMCVFKYFIGCNEDFERAKSIVYEAAAASPYVFLERPVSVALSEGPVPGGAERFAIGLTVKAYVFDGRYETAFGSDVTERVKRAFRATGIRTAGELEWGPARSGPA